MKVRIKILLMVAIGGLVALAVGAVLFVSASANVRNTLELLQERGAATVDSLERGVDAYVTPARSLIAHVRRLVAEGALSPDDEAGLLATLRGSLAAAPQIAGVVFWRPDGSGHWVTRGPGGVIGVRPQQMPPPAPLLAYIGEVGRSSRIDWAEPIMREGLSVMTIAGALYRDSRFVGVIGAGLSLVEMSDFLGNARDASVMTGFVLYGDDRVLAHPALLDETVRDRMSVDRPLLGIGEIGDPVVAALPRLVVEEMPGTIDFEVRSYETGESEEIILSRVSEAYGRVPWRIGVHIPAEVVQQQLRRLVGSIALGLGLLALAVAAGLVLATRIARPIRAISAAAGQVARLDLAGVRPLPPSHIRELDEQARAFNRMLAGLRWFEAYVPRTLVTRLMDAEEGPAMSHRAAELTVMFTDIVGFTRLSEAMPPADVADFLNRHFDMVNQCIEAEGGTLDKYIGDAAMAFWGAPEPFPDHAGRACRAALALMRAVEARNAGGETPPLRLKIAIHTGPLIVGNIGARARMNYTVIGDTVNVAARIERACAAEDDGSAAIVLVSADTARAAGDGFHFDHLGERSVHGRREAVDICRLRP